MLEYLYFHINNCYATKVSDSTKENEKIFFEYAREYLSENDNVLYLPINDDKFVFIYDCKVIKSYSTLNGFYGDLSELQLKGNPTTIVSYINNITQKFDEFIDKIKNVDQFSDIILNNELPTRADFIDNRLNLYNIFGKVFDLICNNKNNKPIVIIVKDYATAINYLKRLNSILPINYFNKIGYKIGRSVNDYSKIVKDNFETTININFIIGEYNKDLSRYYVFNTIKKEDTYKDSAGNDIQLSLIGELLQNDDILNEAYLNQIKEMIVSSMDGNVINFSELNSKIILFKFDNDFDKENVSKEIIKMAINNEYKDKIDVEHKIEVIRYLIESDLIDEKFFDDYVKKILDDDKNNTKNKDVIFLNIKDDLFDYFIGNFSSNTCQNEYLIQIILQSIADSNDIDKFNNLLDICISKLGLFEAFGFVVKIIDKALENDDKWNLISRKLSKSIITTFDIKNCFGIVRDKKMDLFDKIDFDKIDFDKINLDKSNFANNASNYLISVLLCSLFLNDSVKEHNVTRLNYFIDKLEFKKEPFNDFASIVYFISLRSNIKEILNESNLEFDSEVPLFDTDDSKIADYIASKFKKLSLDELLKIYNGAGDYVFVCSLAEKKLLDISFVYNNLNCKADYDAYKSFYGSISAEKKTPEIETFLNNKDKELKAQDELDKYRSDFVNDCFSSLSDENQSKYSAFENSTVNIAENIKQFNFKTYFLNTIFTVNTQKKNLRLNFNSNQSLKLNFGNLKVFFANAFIFSLVTIIILFIPALVIQISLNDISYTFERFEYYFLSYFSFIPLFVFVFYMIIALCLKEGNKVKRASIITFFVLILPLLFFCIGYLISYYIGIKITL